MKLCRYKYGCCLIIQQKELPRAVWFTIILIGRFIYSDNSAEAEGKCAVHTFTFWDSGKIVALIIIIITETISMAP